MGNSVSKDPEEEIYLAVFNNDLSKLQKVISALQGSGRFLPSVHLKYIDKDGRTALQLAAARNFHSCARKLLECGADVHYINTKELKSGTALHEATSHRHEAMAELLLTYGANPFMCNGLGRTCMDQAVMEESGNLLRRFEQMAKWKGTVAVKVNKLGGITTGFKARYLVVVPHIPFPTTTTTSAHQTQAQALTQPNLSQPKTQMWVYKDNSAIAPKSRMWLDGASIVMTSPNDAVLRLHASHKPLSGDLCVKHDRGYCINLRIADATTASATALEQFVSLVASGGGGVSVLDQAYPTMPSLAVPSLSSLSTTPRTSAPSTTWVTATHHLLPRPPVAPTSHNVGSRTATDIGHLLSPPTTTAYGSSTGRAVSDQFVNSMTALPGESDADFASRLASAISAHTGHDQATLSTSQPRASSASAATGTTPHSTNTGSSPTTPAGAHLGALAIWGATPLPTSISAPMAGSPAPPVPLMQPQSPSAPPLQPQVSISASSGGDAAEERQCVICLSAPREAGYLHGASLHLCVCRDCCKSVRPGAPCPLCRQPVERVIDVF